MRKHTDTKRARKRGDAARMRVRLRVQSTPQSAEINERKKKEEKWKKENIMRALYAFL